MKCDSSHTTTWKFLAASLPCIFPTSEYGTMANVAALILCASAPEPTDAMRPGRTSSHRRSASCHASLNDVGTNIRHGHSSR